MKHGLSVGLAIAVALLSGVALAQSKTKIGVSTQPDEHDVSPASCHPHCHPDQGDNVNWQVPYPGDVDLENFRTACRDMGGCLRVRLIGDHDRRRPSCGNNFVAKSL